MLFWNYAGIWNKDIFLEYVKNFDFVNLYETWNRRNMEYRGKGLR